MELKPNMVGDVASFAGVLIVPYGIETSMLIRKSIKIITC